MNIIAYSLYGSDPKYVEGMVRNLRLAPEIYPGWGVTIYMQSDPQLAAHLEELGAEVVTMPFTTPGEAKCWRFLPLADPDVAWCIIRDSDSRLNAKEKAAVDAWVESGKQFHLMHDHDHHRCFPVWPGMMGGTGGSIPDILKLIADYHAVPANAQNSKSDIYFARDVLWPLMEQRGFLRHSSVPLPPEWPAVPFPPHKPHDGFIGQIVDVVEGEDKPVWPGGRR